MPRNDGYNPTAEQQQNMDNLSFDRKYLVNASENLVENTAGDDVVRMKQPMKDTTATDGSQKTQIVETVDTTADNAIDLTYQWSAASVDNTITITNTTIEVIN